MCTSRPRGTRGPRRRAGGRRREGRHLRVRRALAAEGDQRDALLAAALGEAGRRPLPAAAATEHADDAHLRVSSPARASRERVEIGGALRVRAAHGGEVVGRRSTAAAVARISVVGGGDEADHGRASGGNEEVGGAGRRVADGGTGLSSSARLGSPSGTPCSMSSRSRSCRGAARRGRRGRRAHARARRRSRSTGDGTDRARAPRRPSEESAPRLVVLEQSVPAGAERRAVRTGSPRGRSSWRDRRWRRRCRLRAGGVRRARSGPRRRGQRPAVADLVAADVGPQERAASADVAGTLSGAKAVRDRRRPSASTRPAPDSTGSSIHSPAAGSRRRCRGSGAPAAARSRSARSSPSRRR